MGIIGIIIVGAIALRGAYSLIHSHIHRERTKIPYYFQGKAGFKILELYTVVAIPIALANGYMVYSWVGMLMVGLGTWLGMLLANIILRFNPALQFTLFGLINIAWTLFNITQYL